VIAFAVRASVYRAAFRFGWNLARLVAASLLVLVWSACSAAQTIMVEELQPGGNARLRAPGSLQLGGSGLLDLGGGPAPIPGGPGFIGPVQGSTILPTPPPEQWSAMVAASANAPCAFPGPELLAAIAYYESRYGTNPGPSPAGAYGYGQFMPATFVEYGVPVSQANDYGVMLPAMARKLCHDGVAASVDRALLSYNNSLAYVEHIKALAASWDKSISPTWHDGPAFNQFDPRNWSNRDNFTTWSASACSAAALDWMLTAYGQPPGSIDAALALIGPNSGISARVGLLDHTGSVLGSALSRAGLASWRAQLSTAGLAEKLKSGPAMLDGQRWFGVGHWFVAIGSDTGGISIRESSGNNVQYLTWARLAGEVGWSGWAVGVSTPPPANTQA
jgi:hypothetical protein